MIKRTLWEDGDCRCRPTIRFADLLLLVAPSFLVVFTDVRFKRFEPNDVLSGF